MELIKDFFISEKGFAKSMEKIVEPFLAERREDAYFESLDGKEIHYEQYLQENAKGSIVISHGFCESAEKFREMSYYFYKMGLNVFAIDHRGHGLSDGHAENPYIVYLKSFDNYVDDLNCLVNKVVKPVSGNLPLYLYAHSMGGAIGALYLQEYPDDFSKAILSSPMIKAKTAGIPMPIANALTRTFIVLGKGDSKVMGYKVFDPNRTVEESNDTSEERFNYYQQKRRDNINYQTSAPTYRWVNEAIRIVPLNLDEKRCRKITAKVLVCQAEVDADVEIDAEAEFAKLTKDAQVISFKNSKHEIYNSIDSTVLEYLQTIKNFLFD